MSWNRLTCKKLRHDQAQKNHRFQPAPFLVWSIWPTWNYRCISLTPAIPQSRRLGAFGVCKIPRELCGIHVDESWRPSLRPQNSYGSYGHCLSRKHLNLPEIVSPAQILIPWSNHRRSGREEQGQEHVSHPQLHQKLERLGSSCYYEAISILIRKRCMDIYV